MAASGGSTTWRSDWPVAEYHGWRALELRNGVARAALVPDIGGRVMQFWLGEHGFLFNNQRLLGKLFSPEEHWGDGTIASWKNYGGNKTWPAPQGWDGPHQWAGPPDPVLDGGPFQVLEAGPLSAALRSQPDPRSGLQITRVFSLDPLAARAQLRRVMRNASDRTVRWSLWDVTQLDCGEPTPDGTTRMRPGCWMYVPKNPQSRFPDGFQVTYGPPDNPQWGSAGPDLFAMEYQERIGKVGLDACDGWIAFHDRAGDWVLVHQFTYVPGAEYPHGGDSVEIWAQGPGVAAGVDFSLPHLRLHFSEMEVLGPLTTLAPGEQAEATIEWGACRCPGPIRAVTAAGCIGQPLTLERQAGQVWARGQYGLFAPGRVQLRALRRGGPAAVLGEQPAGPLEPLRLDVRAALPEGAIALELVALDSAGTERGLLDRVALSG